MKVQILDDLAVHQRHHHCLIEKNQYIREKIKTMNINDYLMTYLSFSSQTLLAKKKDQTYLRFIVLKQFFA